MALQCVAMHCISLNAIVRRVLSGSTHHFANIYSGPTLLNMVQLETSAMVVHRWTLLYHNKLHQHVICKLSMITVQIADVPHPQLYASFLFRAYDNMCFFCSELCICLRLLLARQNKIKSRSIVELTNYYTDAGSKTDFNIVFEPTLEPTNDANYLQRI